EPRLAPLADANWAEAWREHFHPLAVGRALLIAPPWETPAANSRLVITIEPGRAFGTGHHGTTAGCLAALESILARGPVERAIDLGTGSGILAIAAARLGVQAVLAVDEDPDAVASAVANAARNRVCDRVRCVLGDAGDVHGAPAALVLANIMKAAHLRLAGVYRRCLTPGGTLLLGGILDAEAPEVVAALAPYGLDRRAASSREGWTTLELVRTPNVHA
ncbi:MAG: 50S ribosomal protein L11 methyltransferase, partial [Candidatus Rokuibacteriota bacterium]